MGWVRKTRGIGDEEGGEKTLASRAEEGLERPGGGTEDGAEKRVLGGAPRAVLTRTEEDVATDCRVLSVLAAVVANTAVAVMAVEFRRGLRREDSGRED